MGREGVGKYLCQGHHLDRLPGFLLAIRISENIWPPPTSASTAGVRTPDLLDANEWNFGDLRVCSLGVCVDASVCAGQGVLVVLVALTGESKAAASQRQAAASGLWPGGHNLN